MAEPTKTPSALDDLAQAATNTASFVQSQMPAVKAAASSAVAPLTKAYQNTLDYYGGVAKKLASQLPGSVSKITSGTATSLKPITQPTKAIGKELYQQATKKEESPIITDKQRTEAENRALINPLQANGFEARSQAIGGKRQRMINSDVYKNLPAHEKLQQDIMFYKRYVRPTFVEAGKQPIPLKEWLSHSRPGLQREMGYGTDIIGGATKGALGIAIAGAEFNRKEWSAIYGFNHFYKNLAHGEFDAGKAWEQGKKDAQNSLVTRAIGSMQGGLDEVNFLINSRPRDNMLSQASVWGGEMLAQAPVYEAIGAAGKPLLAAGESANLTKTLMATKTGQWVAKRMVSAADGYLSGKATGMTEEESRRQARDLALLGAAGSVIKPGWQKLAKRFSAEVVAAGGEPMAADLAESAMAELDGEATKKPPSGGGPDEPPPSGGRPADDHVNNKMHDAEKDIFRKIAKEMYPEKEWKDLTKAEKGKVLVARGKLSHTAAAEAPAHLPDLVHAQETHAIEEWNKANPDSAEITKLLTEAGVDVGKANAENIINTVEHQTGLTNPERAASAVADAPLQHTTAELVAERTPAEKANAEPSGTLPETRSVELHHGSRNWEKIEKEGFTIPEKSGVSLFGRGIYLAEHPAYAQQYGDVRRVKFTGKVTQMTRKEFEKEIRSDEFEKFMKEQGAGEDANEKDYVAPYFRSKGIDAVHIAEGDDPTNQLIVYNKNKISYKSTRAPEGTVEKLSAAEKKALAERKEKYFERRRAQNLWTEEEIERRWNERGKEIAIRNARRAVAMEALVGEHRANIAQAASTARREMGWAEPLAAPEKVGKTIEGTFEPKEGASAAVNMAEFMDVHNDVKAFYKNPKGRLAADGTMVGARDKRPWNVRMRDENTRKFDEMLRDIDGNKIPFEKWEDRALWHLNFEKDMDASMRRKLRYQLENAKRLQVGGKKSTRAQLNARARRTAEHLKMLIETGRLRKGETFFASTKSAGRRTPWQIELRTERDLKSVRTIKNNVKRTKNGPEMVDAIVNILKP